MQTLCCLSGFTSVLYHPRLNANIVLSFWLYIGFVSPTIECKHCVVFLALHRFSYTHDLMQALCCLSGFTSVQFHPRFNASIVLSFWLYISSVTHTIYCKHCVVFLALRRFHFTHDLLQTLPAFESIPSDPFSGTKEPDALRPDLSSSGRQGQVAGCFSSLPYQHEPEKV